MPVRFARHEGLSVRINGEWPDRIVLRQGLSKAEARPWNRDTPDAHLALVRGGSDFLAACAAELRASGIPSVLSPPLPSGSVEMWKRAGYDIFEKLDVFGRGLAEPPPESTIPVDHLRRPSWSDIENVDRAAFEPFWRLDVRGLLDAFRATPHAAVFTVGSNPITGFAIVGVGSFAGYLQRIAVVPDHQNRGLGHALVRASLRWAHRHGARQMLLNTLPADGAPNHLYETEGFSRLDDHLTIVRSKPA